MKKYIDKHGVLIGKPAVLMYSVDWDIDGAEVVLHSIHTLKDMLIQDEVKSSLQADEISEIESELARYENDLWSENHTGIKAKL